MCNQNNCNEFSCSIGQNRPLGKSLDPSRINELSFISEYIYQSIIFEDMYPKLSQLYDKIAMQKMEHYKLLSELQLRLGVNPCVNMRLNINPIDITEDRDSIAPRAALRSLHCFIRSELASAEEYRRLSCEADTPYISRLLSEFANDEERHATELLEFEKCIVTN